jgi:hypothetical protein
MDMMKYRWPSLTVACALVVLTGCGGGGDGTGPSNPSGPSGATCTMTLSRTTVPVDAINATANVNVETGNGCSWTATSEAEWIRITAGASGRGQARVVFTVENNPTFNSRSGTMTIAGQQVTVVQEAPNLSGRWGVTGTGALRSLEFNVVRGNTVTRARFAYEFPVSGGRVCERVFVDDYAIPLTDGQFRLTFQAAGMSTALAVAFSSPQLATGTLDQQVFNNVSCGAGVTFSGSVGGGAVSFVKTD